MIRRCLLRRCGESTRLRGRSSGSRGTNSGRLGRTVFGIGLFRVTMDRKHRSGDLCHLVRDIHGVVCYWAVAHSCVETMARAGGLQSRAFDAGFVTHLLKHLTDERFGVASAAVTRQRSHGINSGDVGGHDDGGARDGDSIRIADVATERALPRALGAVHFTADGPGYIEGDGSDVCEGGPRGLIRDRLYFDDR